MRIMESTFDKHWVMYRGVEALGCTPETTLRVYVYYTVAVVVIVVVAVVIIINNNKRQTDGPWPIFNQNNT